MKLPKISGKEVIVLLEKRGFVIRIGLEQG